MSERRKTRQKREILRIKTTDEKPALPDMAEAVACFAEAQRSVLKESLCNIQGIAESFNQFQDTAEAVNRHFLETTKGIAKAIEQWFGNQEEDIRSSFERLARHGWFPDPSMSLTLSTRLAGLVDDQPDVVDKAVSALLRERFDEIEAELVESYPDRAHLLHDAFEAHRKSTYTLSIPVFLTQAEGFVWDRCSKALYNQNQRRTAVKGLRTQVQYRSFDAFLEPLMISTPLWKPGAKLGTTFAGLNRHQVLHGVSADYDTEVNSLRAVSFLSYIHWILNQIVEEENRSE